MAIKSTKPCPNCNGEGLVPREVRRLPNGDPDQFDTVDWPSVICGVCGGSGRIADAAR